MFLSLTDSAVLLTAFVCWTIASFVHYTDYMRCFWDIHPYVVVYVHPLHLVAHTATTWVTVLIAASRYISVCIPLRASQWCNISKVKIQLAIVIMLAVLYNIPTFMQFRIAHASSNNGTTHTAHLVPTKLWLAREYQLVYSTILCAICISVLPSCIIAFLNIRLIKALKTRRRTQTQRRHQLRSPNKHSMTLILIIICIVSIVCQMPSLVTRVLWLLTTYTASTCGGYLLYQGHISNMLIVLNSAVNFIIYVICNKCFRDVLNGKVCRRHAPQHVDIADEMPGGEMAKDRLVDETRY